MSHAAPKEWREHKTRHFIISFKDAPQEVVQQIGQEAEEVFGQIADNMGLDSYPNWRSDQRLKIVVYNDQEDYRTSNIKTEHASWSSGMAEYSTHSIKTYPQQLDYLLNSMVPHELGHFLLMESVGFKADIPGWFSEGIAGMQEKNSPSGEDRVKKIVDEKGFLSLKDLMRETMEVSDFYEVSYSATRYLLSRISGTKFNMFLKQLRNGETFNNALKNVSNGRIKGLDAMNRDWINDIKEH